MIKFNRIKNILSEKIRIHQNKNINIFFNSYKGHSLSDKLERSGITETEFKQVLNKLTKKIKSEKLSSGNYNFIFKEFKLPVYYNKEKKELEIKTILTKKMSAKKDDTNLIMENVEYKNIYVDI